MEERNFKIGTALVLTMGLLVALRLAGSVADSSRASDIVQADSAVSAAAAVQAVGGEMYTGPGDPRGTRCTFELPF